MRKIVIVVCTLKRPQMLMNCLKSLARQYMPDDWQFEIAVIDNDAIPTTEETICEFRKTVTVPVHYIHEPVRGIPYARNAGLECALRENADWVAMIDDDETAPPYWLATLIDGLNLYGCDIVTGFVSAAIDNPPAWWVDPHYRPQIDGKIMSEAATNNVLFPIGLIHSDKHNLRFCTSMIGGGEDSDFFIKATQKGYVIRWVAGATVSEEIPLERQTLNRMIEREKKQVYYNIIDKKRNKQFNPVNLLFKHSFYIIRYSFILLLSCFIFIFHSRLGKLFFIYTFRKISISIENLKVILLNKTQNFYSQIDGK